jgi:hypothetical protein
MDEVEWLFLSLPAEIKKSITCAVIFFAQAGESVTQ